MTYLFLTSSQDDAEFARRLRDDLAKEGVSLYADEGKPDGAMEHLNKATHLLAILSPSILTSEAALGAMEFAKQNRLERLAVRIASVETMPPQIAGVLPLSATDDEGYINSLETLLEDLQEPQAETSESLLPEEIMTAIYSDNAQIRRNAIETLGEYRTAEPALKEAARDELNALVFRERDSALKTLLRTTVQSFDLADKPAEQATPKISMPSKEELQTSAKATGHSVTVGEPETETVYLWQTGRWYPVLIGLAIIVALILFIVGGHWGYLLPMVVAGLLVPAFNASLRGTGELAWEMPGPLSWNALIGFLLGWALSGIVMLIDSDLETPFMLVNVLATVSYSTLVGWLSALGFEVAA